VPVVGSFQVVVEMVNRDSKERICNEIIERQTQSMGLEDLNNEEEEPEEAAVKL
jgi:hypothetical protein